MTKEGSSQSSTVWLLVSDVSTLQHTEALSRRVQILQTHRTVGVSDFLHTLSTSDHTRSPTDPSQKTGPDQFSSFMSPRLAESVAGSVVMIGYERCHVYCNSTASRWGLSSRPPTLAHPPTFRSWRRY